jgi:four helix bundle protein
MADFKKLAVWRKAHELMLSVHRVTAQMRGAQHAALRNQLMRAAMSIPANIVEGRGQKSERDFARFLGYSLNSTSEREYHVIAGRDTRAIPEAAALGLLGQIIEVRRMLHGLISRLNNPAGARKAIEESSDSAEERAAEEAPP